MGGETSKAKYKSETCRRLSRIKQKDKHFIVTQEKKKYEYIQI